jgi:hypothetical protein
MEGRMGQQGRPWSGPRGDNREIGDSEVVRQPDAAKETARATGRRAGCTPGGR